MGVLRIPVEPYPDTTQQSDLDGVTYSFRFRWNQRSARWHMDLSTLDGSPIASGIALVPSFPLLRRLTHPSRPPGEIYLIDLAGQAESPTLEEFGTRFALFYVESGT